MESRDESDGRELLDQLEARGRISFVGVTDHGATHFTAATARVDAALSSLSVPEARLSAERLADVPWDPRATLSASTTTTTSDSYVDSSATVHGGGVAGGLVVSHMAPSRTRSLGQPVEARRPSSLVVLIPGSGGDGVGGGDEIVVAPGAAGSPPVSTRLLRTLSRLGTTAAGWSSDAVVAAGGKGSSSGRALSGHLQRNVMDDEALCRICFVELGEGGETLKLECDCKGELALAHKACAIKWFSLKGTRVCEVCRKEVINLPVILTRHPSTAPPRPVPSPHWQELPLMFIGGILAYFCYYEQLLVSRFEKHALYVALPCGIVLGVGATLLSRRIERRRAWVYLLFQFIMVICFTQIMFYTGKTPPIVAVTVGALLGSGFGFALHELIVEGVPRLQGQESPRQRRRRERAERRAGSEAAVADEAGGPDLEEARGLEGGDAEGPEAREAEGGSAATLQGEGAGDAAAVTGSGESSEVVEPEEQRGADLAGAELRAIAVTSL